MKKPDFSVLVEIAGDSLPAEAVAKFSFVDGRVATALLTIDALSGRSEGDFAGSQVMFNAWRCSGVFSNDEMEWMSDELIDRLHAEIRRIALRETEQ